MSTRCAIVTKTSDGYAGIYCQHDGYPSGVGKTLKKYYTTPETVAALIALGDISSLGATLEAPGTEAYMRDAGETGCEAQSGSTIQEVTRNMGGIEFTYLFDGKVWSNPC